MPLLRRSYELWRELEEDRDAAAPKLMRITGIVEIGLPAARWWPARSPPHANTICRTKSSMAPRPCGGFRPFRIPSDYVGVFQPDGGFLAAEATRRGMLALARAAEAEIRNRRPRAVGRAAWQRRAHPDQRRRDRGRAAIVAAGPWLKELAARLPLPLRATREVMAWFEPRDPAPFAPGRFPVFMLESRHGMHYGFPISPAGTVKIAKHHHHDETVYPDDPRRPVSGGRRGADPAALESHIPAANGPLAAAKTCLYTMTPDHDFIIDRLPGAPNIIVASPCSGHGFKFAPVIGEILADWRRPAATEHDISRFGLAGSGCDPASRPGSYAASAPKGCGSRMAC